MIDAAHTVTAYWYGKNKAASLFGTGPVFGADASQILAWIQYGGGDALYKELINDILGLNLVGFFCMPMPTQPLGWFTERITSEQQLEGLKYRTVGLATDIMQGIGVKVTQLPGGEIVPALERGVIEAFEFNNPTSDMQFGAQDVRKVYMMGQLPSGRRVLRDHLQQGEVRVPGSGSPSDPGAQRRGRQHGPTSASPWTTTRATCRS